MILTILCSLLATLVSSLAEPGSNNPPATPGVDDGTGDLNDLLPLIFDKYHKELVPKRPTVIKMDLLLLKVKSTIEKEGIFESVVAIFLNWEDKRITWDPKKYQNVTMMAFDSDRIWLPDVAMTNSADHLYTISRDTRFVVRVQYDGTMKFVPTGTSRTWCDLKLLEFPFDIQTCSFEFESWSLDSTAMTFDKGSAAVVDDAFSSPQWSLCQSRAVVYDHFYNFTGETFTRVRYDFIVRRKSTFYVINLIFPCATLSIIQLLVFIIPSTDSTSDRVGFGTTNLLTLVVFQTIVTAEMPKSSDAVTALSKYIIALILASALGIFQSVIIERMLRDTTRAPPKIAMKLLDWFPLLWGSQMPSGINQMILEGGSAVHGGAMKAESSIKKGLGELVATGKPTKSPIKISPSSSRKSSISSNTKRNQTDRYFGEPKRANLKIVDRMPQKNGADDEDFLHFDLDKIQSTPILDRRINGESACRYKYAIEVSEGRVDINSPSPCIQIIPPSYKIAGPINGCVVGDTPSHKKQLVPILKTPRKDSVHEDDFAKLEKKQGFYNKKHSISSCDDTEDGDNDDEEYGENADQEEIVRVHIHNGMKWGRLITKVDHLTFLFCLAVSIGSPIALFVPLVIEGMYDCELNL